MYSPTDIESKQFTTTRLKEGYDQNEVDSFLDGVALDYKAHIGKIQTLEHALRVEQSKRMEAATAVLPVAPPSDTPSIASIEKLLVVAQQTADQTLTDANTEAESIRVEASADAERIIAEAQSKAAALTEKAEQGVQEATNKVNALKERERYYKTWIKNALSSFERELNNG